VKVVQRIPVRIGCERKADDPPFRAGMSVIADIDTGHVRSWHDLF
jgi:membrane fusion protein (multidrug efflux system)